MRHPPQDMHRFTIVGLGEILWDLLPAGKQLGGAPANFAYHAQSLGLKFGHYFGSGSRLEAGLDGLKTQICRLEQFGVLDSLLSEQSE